MPRTLILFCLLLQTAAAPAAPALFWLSLDDSGPLDPAVPEVTGVLDVPRRVHIWAQPQTTGSTTLQNISLNVVSPSSGFNVDPNTIEVYNPNYTNGHDRFEFVSDSADGLISVDTGLPTGMNRGIANLQGFTIDTSLADGFGGSCDAADNYCSTTSGSDAWLFASFTLTPTATGSNAELYLEVGLNGMNHTGENPVDMTVAFGVQSGGGAPTYSPATEYDLTYAQIMAKGDDPDAVFSLVKPGDYDADGDVDTDDYGEWRDLYGTTDSAADGNSDGVVDAADYAIWRNNYPTPKAPVALSPVPEPMAVSLLISAFFTIRAAFGPGLSRAEGRRTRRMQGWTRMFKLRTRPNRPRGASACE